MHIAHPLIALNIFGTISPIEGAVIGSNVKTG